MTLNPPSPKEIFSNNQARWECVVTGQDQTSLNQIKVIWQVDGREKDAQNSTNSEGGQLKITSKITLPLTEWQKVNKVRCSAVKDGVIQFKELTVHKGGSFHTHMHILQFAVNNRNFCGPSC